MELVIAHFNENLDWVFKLPSDIQITIYYKGNPPPLPLVGIQRPNVPGIDVETHINHLITRYHTLSDVTNFVQGNPWDHCNSVTDEAKDFLWLGCNYGIAEDWPQTDPSLAPLYMAVFNRQIPRVLEYKTGSCFSVTKECVHRKPLSFYENLLESCLDICPIWFNCTLERLWWNIFNDPLTVDLPI